MKKIIQTHVRIAFVLFSLFISKYSFSQTVQVVSNPSQTSNIVVGPNNYHVSEYIYTETEIGAGNFTTPADAITHIDFNVFALGTVTTIDSFNIYLKEVPLATTTFATGAYNTAGYTLVFSGTFNAAVTGWVGVDFTNSFIRNSGNNLQLLIERRDSVLHGGYSFSATRGNNTDINALSSRRVNLATKPISGTTVLNTTSAFRPQIQLRHINPNDAGITAVYTLGKLPIPFATPHIISANIVNNGSNTLTNWDVNLSITGANTFSNTKTIASLAPGASVIVFFDTYTPSATGFNSVTVSLPADDFAGDNTSAISQETTNNAYTYAYGTVPSNASGLAGVTGDFVAMFTSSSNTSINQVGINFAAGARPFRVGIWDKSGTGKPGNLLWESTDQLSVEGVFTLPINPPVAISDTFYIGVRQTTTNNVQFAYQAENPIRPNTFFYTTPSGGTTWTDFAPANPFRFMIEPRLTIANDVGVASITNPVGASSIDNCGILPEALITNFGSNNQTTPFDVTFSIKQSGAVVYTDTKQVALNSGESKPVYFAPFTGSVSGDDSSFVITQLASDGAANNDTVFNRFSTGIFSYSDSVAGSDGYSYANSTFCASLAPFRPTYNWITQTDNQINWGTNGDDSVLSTPVSLPFPFKFFGNTYNQFWVCSNGWISFSDPTTLSAAAMRTPVGIPAAGGINNYIAGIFANLDNTSATYADAQTFYGEDASGFVITFHHAHLAGSADNYITFQIILKVSGDILIQYNDAESTTPAVTSITNFCSVGIENASGTNGVQYRLNGSGGSIFESPLAVQFYARPTAPVPVTLLYFTAEKGKYANKLSWSTTQEINTREFIIERSHNGIDFAVMGNMTAKGNNYQTTPYSFTDQHPAEGTNYYRLKIAGFDNLVSYSAIKTITNGKQQGFSVYPNPVKDKVTAWFTANTVSPAEVNIIDLNGKVVYTKKIITTASQNTVTIDTEGFATGMYIIKIYSAENSFTGKFTKK